MLRLTTLSLLAAAMAAALAGCARAPASPGPPVEKIEFLGQWGERGDGPSQLLAPTAMATDAQGLVYIADRATHFLHKFAPDGAPLFALTESRLRRPSAITVDRGGAIYVADAASGIVHIYFPEGEHLRDFSGGPRMHFQEPSAVAVDDSGDIYVADLGAARIEEFSPRGRFLRAWWDRAARPTIVRATAEAPRSRGKRAGAKATAAAADASAYPAGGDAADLVIAPDGAVFLADLRRNLIRKFSPALESLANWGSGGAGEQFRSLSGAALANGSLVAVDAGKRELSVWSLDGHRRLSFDLSPYSSPAGESASPPGHPPALRLAVSGRDRLLLLDPSAPRVLCFRLRDSP